MSCEFSEENEMDLKQLLQKYQKIDAYFEEQFPDMQPEFKILARLGKITEELGELNSEVHGELQLHRDDKQVHHNHENVAKEWADVFNTVILMGIVLKLDIPEVIEARLREIFERYHLTK